MGVINYGNQLITLDYYNDVTSATINQRFTDIRERGVYKGGYLTKVSNVSITLSTLICEIGDSSYQVSVQTQSTVTTTVSVATPWVILRWAYTGAVGNYMDVLAVAVGSIQANDLIVGKCTYAGSTLTGFDYNDSSYPRSTPVTLGLYMKVIPTETASMSVRVRAGSIYSGSARVSVADQTTALITAPTGNPRIDLVYVNQDGTVQVQTGTEAASPSAPNYRGRLVLAELYLTVGMTQITVSNIIRALAYPAMYSSHRVDYLSDLRIASTSATAAAITLTDAVISGYPVGAVSVTPDLNTSGVNGLDTGVKATGWYYIYVIYKPSTDTSAGLFSLSATAPTMPTGYTAKRRVGCIYYDGSSIYGFTQAGEKVYWNIQKQLASASVTSPTVINCANFCCPVSRRVIIQRQAYDVASAYRFLYLGWDGTNSLVTGYLQGDVGRFYYDVCEVPTNASRQIYYWSSAAISQDKVMSLGYVFPLNA